MEYYIGTVAVVGFAVVSGCFWYDYRASACGYGGSNSGRDNWALRLLRKPGILFRRISEKLRYSREHMHEHSDFQDVFNL